MDLVGDLMDLPSWTRLANLLDRYDPEGFLDDALLSDEVLEYFCEKCQLRDDATKVFWEALDEVGVEIARKHRRQVTPAIEAFVADVPRWDLNGWSHAELRGSLRLS